MQQPEHVAIWWLMLISLFGWLHPESAAGAVFGGMFFWGLNPEIKPSTRLLFLVASVGVGYGMSLPAARSPEWASWAWLLAGFSTVLVHVMIVSMRAVVTTGSALPPWMTAIIDALPWRRPRGDGQ